MREYSTEEKYNYLLDRLELEDVDFYEKDGMVRFKPLYFQFGSNEAPNVVAAIEWAMNDEGI